VTVASNLYVRILEHVFLSKFQEGQETIDFEREDIERAATELGLRSPKNLGDVIYSFRFRRPLPEAIRARAPQDRIWIIRGAGKSRYRFVAAVDVPLQPNRLLAEIKVPDSTPGVIAMYALDDEQALLAKLRYNRLIDIFTGVTCNSLQSHLRTQVRGLGQTESDEVYIGVDRRGAHYVFPIQAKGGSDKLSIVQIEQDLAMCAAKFPALICRPIAAQFMSDDIIALFDFTDTDRGIAIVSERHYRLVPAGSLSEAELVDYGRQQ